MSTGKITPDLNMLHFIIPVHLFSKNVVLVTNFIIVTPTFGFSLSRVFCIVYVVVVEKEK